MRELNWIFDVSQKFPEITKSGIVLLIFMLQQSNKHSELAISQSQIEEMSGIEKRHAKRQIQELISYKLISISEHGNRTKSNTYKIHFQKENDMQMEAADCFISSINIAEKLQPIIANILHEEFVKVSNYDAP